MNAISLFSGCLGLDLGLEAAGWEILWACESDKACRRVIERQRPGLDVLEDVREVDAGMPRAELLAGGFPCQDLSHAGAGAGLTGDRSALWFAMADTIRLLRPRLVLIENVPGLATKMGARAGESALGTVIADLAEAGYVGSALRLRAADVGACHLRERIFLVAADTDDSAWSPEEGERGRGALQGAEEPGEPALESGRRGRRDQGAGGVAPADAEGDSDQELAEGDDAAALLGDRSRAGARTDARGDPEGVRERGGDASGGSPAPPDSGGARRREDAGGSPGDEGEPAGGAEVADHESLGAGSSGLHAASPADAGSSRRSRGKARGVARRGTGPAGDRSAPADSGDGADDGERAREEPREGSEAPPDALGLGRGGRPDIEGEGATGGVGPSSDGEDAADADGAGLGEHGGPVSVRAELGASERGGDASPADAGRESREPGSGGRASGGDHARGGAPERDGDRHVGPAEPGEDAADADRVGRRLIGVEERGDDEGASWDIPDRRNGEIEWGVYEPAIRNWEYIFGHPAPHPTDDRGRLSPDFVEWMMGFPAGWTEGESRTSRLRMLGNAVHVQVGEVMGWILADAARGE